MKWLVFLCCLWIVGCSSTNRPQEPTKILLISLDTVRQDRFGFSGAEVSQTPELDELATGASVYLNAFAPVPTTLASHTSMLTGLYPYEHGIRENGRVLNAAVPMIQEQLEGRAVAVVSGYPLASQFGLSRGFAAYLQPEGSERPANDTVDLALEHLANSDFLWCHFYDPHAPHLQHPDFNRDLAYDSEIAFVDHHVSRLIKACKQHWGDSPHAIIVVGDHGEGLGDLGEQGHGILLGNATLHVPLLVWTSWEPGSRYERPVSIRRVADMIRDLSKGSFDGAKYTEDIVIAESMQPYLQFGWAPLMAAISQQEKMVRGKSFRLVMGRDEAPNSAPNGHPLRSKLENIPFEPARVQSELTLADIETLASLGYTANDAISPIGLEDRPDPYDQVPLIGQLDRASHLFANHHYAEALSEFESLAEQDPGNPSVLMRMAVCTSMLGHETLADERFHQAAALLPDSNDLRLYYGLHCARFSRWTQAIELLQGFRSREVALLALERAYDATGQSDQALIVAQQLASSQKTAQAATRWADMAERLGDQAQKAEALEMAWQWDPSGFDRHLDLGMVLMDQGRLNDAAGMLQQVPETDPFYAIACYRRAQIAAIRHEADLSIWLDRALQLASPNLRQTIENDPLLKQ